MFQPFPAICLQLTRAVGKHTLEPSPSLDESKCLLPLNVVTMKKKRTWIIRNTNKYSTHNISLKDLLIYQHVLDAQVEESPFCSYNPESTYSLNGKFQAGINAIIGAIGSTSTTDRITSKLGKLLQRDISYANFMSAFKERKLDMRHHFITEIISTGAVLCVIRCVITTSDKAEIKCTNKTDGNIKVSEKVRGTIDVDIGAATGSSNHMVIEPGTTLAYKVWKLRVDVDSGEIIPMMMEDNNGGFFKKQPPQSNVQKKTQPNVKSGGKRSGKHNKGNPPSHSNDKDMESSGKRIGIDSLNNDTVMQPLRKRTRIYSAINDKDMESFWKRIGIDSLNNDTAKGEINFPFSGNQSEFSKSSRRCDSCNDVQGKRNARNNVETAPISEYRGQFYSVIDIAQRERKVLHNSKLCRLLNTEERRDFNPPKPSKPV